MIINQRNIAQKLLFIAIAAIAFLAYACSSTRHVPAGQMLLDQVDININDSTGLITKSSLIDYLRQTPNHKVLGFARLQLGIYNLSGQDSTKWYNKWLRRLGQAPVIFNEDLTAASSSQLRQSLINRGYMQAKVDVDTISNANHRKMKVAYNVTPGQPHVINSLNVEIADSAINNILKADSLNSLLVTGSSFDLNTLDNERTRITTLMRNNGYYGFIKDYVTFIADTAENSLEVDLTMVVNSPQIDATSKKFGMHKKYIINSVTIVCGETSSNAQTSDTTYYKGLNIIYTDAADEFLRPSILNEKCFLARDQSYSPANVERTYESFMQLGIVRSVNIDIQPGGSVGDIGLLDCRIMLTRNKLQGVTFEIEGTNSEGDFGFGLGMAYQYRNLGRRSNLLSTKLRVNYESLSGNLSNLINDRYTEYAAEVGVTFPKFMMPLTTAAQRRRSKASTQLALSFNYQQRPEYTRVIAGAAWKYRWNKLDNTMRSTWDLIDVNYVYLPESTIDFINQIAPTNPLLRYSYEDHFIMRMGYSMSLTNRRIDSPSLKQQRLQPSVYTFRASVETAGNLLYAISSLSHQNRENGVYKVFGIQYSQYAKAEFDYSHTINLSQRHSLAFHSAFGIGVPYGNSRVLPFEKRFYAGGANGVRGWSVRTLGPGSFDSRNTVTDFINQCGDIKLDLSAEYRAKLFWVMEGALFVDAGNIWTIHNYENQPGGMFHFNTFWRQIALAYGAGLRFDFTYFLLRLDLGLKAHNPAKGQDPWPIAHPNWKRDATFHFAVGYPF